MAGQLLLHYEWMCEIQGHMAPDAFADRRLPDAPGDRVALARVAPFSFAQYCKSFCRVVMDGTRVQKLELLFQLYARERPRRLSFGELRDVVLKHISLSGKFARDGPLKNAGVPEEMDTTFAILDGDGDGYLDKDEYLELWAGREKGATLAHFKGSYLGRCPLVSAGFERVIISRNRLEA